MAADPNNLPFSNDKEEGFENKLAELVAKDLGCNLKYVWRAQRRGFFRETLKAAQADLVMGAPTGFDLAQSTIPYYRSCYVFVTRQNRGLKISSFDELLLRRIRVGVQLIGDDGVNTPPAHAFAKRGIITNLVGFTLYGDYQQPDPPARIVEAVARGDIDTAVVWGPLAGYVVKNQNLPLTISPILNNKDDEPLHFEFSISMGARRGNKELCERLNKIIVNRRQEIETLLRSYGVPLLKLPEKREGK